MQEFLNDHGMVWVGGEVCKKCHDVQDLLSPDMWSPSGPSDPMKDINYDRVIKNIQELNALAGEGSSKVTRNSQRATLKVYQVIAVFWLSMLTTRIYLKNLPTSWRTFKWKKLLLWYDAWLIYINIYINIYIQIVSRGSQWATIPTDNLK